MSGMILEHHVMNMQNWVVKALDNCSTSP